MKPGQSLKLILVSILLMLLTISAFAQERELKFSVHNKTEKEVVNFTQAKSPMGVEVYEALESYLNDKSKFEFVILKDTILTYRSKIDNQLKKIGYFVTKSAKTQVRVTEIFINHSVNATMYATKVDTLKRFEIVADSLEIVGDSLEFEEAKNFGVTPVVLNPNLIPQKELERRKKDLTRKYRKAYNLLQRGKSNVSFSLLDRIMYDLAHSMCNDGLFKSKRPIAYFVTPIGIIDQLINKPANIVGKMQVKSALKQLAKLKKLKADLQAAQRLYEKQYLVKE